MPCCSGAGHCTHFQQPAFFHILEFFPDGQYLLLNGKKRVHNRGVKVRPAALCDDVQGFGNGQGLSVGSLGGQGVENVGNRRDSSFKGNFGSAETSGIAASIPFFVMGERDRLTCPDNVTVGFGQNARPDHGVPFHDDPFLGIEPAGFQKDVVGHPDFADIMEL